MSKVSDSQKKARNKWDSENMATISCKMKKEQIKRFKECATIQGMTANALLRKFVLDVIGENENNP